MTQLDDHSRERLIQLASGEWVERDVLNIAEKLKEYDENLRLQYLDPSNPEAQVGDPPWRIVEMCRDGLPRVVMTAWELDERILERIYAADTSRRDLLAVIDGHNQRLHAERVRRYEEEKAQDIDIIESYLKSPKGRWSFENPRVPGRIVTLDDDPARQPNPPVEE